MIAEMRIDNPDALGGFGCKLQMTNVSDEFIIFRVFDIGIEILHAIKLQPQSPIGTGLKDNGVKKGVTCRNNWVILAPNA